MASLICVLEVQTKTGRATRCRGFLAPMTDKYQLPILAVGQLRFELVAAPCTENGGDHAGICH